MRQTRTQPVEPMPLVFSRSAVSRYCRCNAPDLSQTFWTSAMLAGFRHSLTGHRWISSGDARDESEDADARRDPRMFRLTFAIVLVASLACAI